MLRCAAPNLFSYLVLLQMFWCYTPLNTFIVIFATEVEICCNSSVLFEKHFFSPLHHRHDLFGLYIPDAKYYVSTFQTQNIASLRELSIFNFSLFTFPFLLSTCHLSLVTCHFSLVTCHLSLVTCHLSLLTFHFPLSTAPLHAFRF